MLKYVQRFIRFLSVHPLSLSLSAYVLFVYVAVCLFLFLWLFLSAKITDKRCWSKWESPICMSVVLKCCARRLLYMALLSMSVSRHQCVCVICGGERAQLITTYIGAHMSSSALRENQVLNEKVMTRNIFCISSLYNLNLIMI